MKTPPKAEVPASLCWQAKTGETWARLQERTDAELEPLGRLSLDRLAVRPGERALDVGCGAGQTVLQLAELVGAKGHVSGVDISAPLLKRARERVTEAQLVHVDLRLGDAASMRFDERFDVCFSRFGVMFFEDSGAGFRNLKRALHPGGRLGFVCWQGREKNAWATVLLDAVLGVVPQQPPPDLLTPDAPGPFRFADGAGLERLLRAAGFREISVEASAQQLLLGGQTLEEAVEYCLEIGPAARVIADADPALKPRFRGTIEAALAPYAGPQGVRLGAAVHLVNARA